MFDKLGILAAVALAAIAVAAPAKQQTAPTGVAAQPSATSVTIPFSPPVGVPLRYRFTKTMFGPAERTITLDFTARFDRAGDGYRMTVAYQLPPAAGARSRDPALLVLQRPLSLRIGADGTLLSLDDEPAYWAGVEALLARMVAEDGGGTPEGREAMRRIVADMRGLPEDVRVEKLAENFLPLIAMSGAELIISEPVTWTGETETIFGPLTANQTLTLDRVADGIAYIKSETTVPREDMDEAMRTMFARLTPPGAGRPVPPDFRFHSAENSEISEVAIETGLTRRYRATRTIDLEAQGQRQRGGTVISLERLE